MENLWDHSTAKLSTILRIPASRSWTSIWSQDCVIYYKPIWALNSLFVFLHQMFAIGQEGWLTSWHFIWPITNYFGPFRRDSTHSCSDPKRSLFFWCKLAQCYCTKSSDKLKHVTFRMRSLSRVPQFIKINLDFIFYSSAYVHSSKKAWRELIH